MSDTDTAELRDSTVDSAAPGQTLLNFFGEGGRSDSSTDEGRELCQDRESFEHWWVVSRPPANDTFGADDITEYVMHRLGGNDVIASASMNREIASKVRTALSRDLDEGEVVLYTGDGTDSSLMVLQPGGDILLKTSGTVKIGGDSADSFLTRYTELKALYDTAVTGEKPVFDGHGHMYLNAVGAPTISSSPVSAGIAPVPPGVITTFPAWDPNIASASGETD